jgi:hypothetical protein
LKKGLTENARIGVIIWLPEDSENEKIRTLKTTSSYLQTLSFYNSSKPCVIQQ